MHIEPFALERYFARYEFSARYLLSSSDCDGMPLHELLGYADDEARGLWDNLTLGYTESQGLPLLRQEIAGLYDGITPDQVLEAAPEEGVFLTMNALLRPGDHVVCAFPGYQSLYQIAESLGCRVSRWEPDEAQGWRFDPAVLRSLVMPETRLIVVNFPHNPTGYLPPRDDFDAVVEVARERGLYLFSDEMYRFLEHDRADRLPSAAEVYYRAVSLFGMSKTFGLAGLRVGWVVTKDAEVYGRMTALKDYTTICPPAPSEVLTLIGLRARDRIVASHLATVRRNLALLDGFFARHAGRFAWVRPRAGTIGFARFLRDQGAEAFCRRVVDESGVMLLPSTVYGYGDRHVRIGFGRRNLPEALAALEAYLTKPTH
jgi:aspartate/methionine/tyrosine aminotransferase